MLKLFTKTTITLLITILFLITSITSNAATVSWYGKPFHGRLTASGERYDMNKLTCASNSHKMGTKLQVTNKDNGLSVTCKVNDTGGFKKYGRTLDLSRGAFAKIADLDKGLCKVKIKVIK